MTNKDINIVEITQCFNKIYNICYFLEIENIARALEIFKNRIIKHIEENN